MRIERNNIRMGLAGAKSNWEKNQLSQRKKLFAKLRKMNATTEKAKELVFLPLEVDHDYFDIPHIYYGERNPLVEYINQWTICIRIDIDSIFHLLPLNPSDKHPILHQKKCFDLSSLK